MDTSVFFYLYDDYSQSQIQYNHTHIYWLIKFHKNNINPLYFQSPIAILANYNSFTKHGSDNCKLPVGIIIDAELM